MQTQLLGFDARHMDAGELWDAARREIFLLRTDVELPLSADVLVWPSLFDYGQGIGMAESERKRSRQAGFPTPAWIGANSGLWENLEAMRRQLEASALPADARYAVIAVSWVAAGEFRGGNVGPYAEPTAPAEVEPGWELLGYDVCDGSLVSGLSNCGYRAEEAQVLRARWAGQLNEHHLFRDWEQAEGFCQGANERAPEHAPFLVYGLYVVGQRGESGTSRH